MSYPIQQTHPARNRLYLIRQAGILLIILLAAALTSFAPLPQDDSPHSRPKTQARPFLSGSPTFYDTQHFRIHYTLEGEDAISARDADTDQLPDYVTEVAEVLEYAWTIEVDQLGWSPPLPDRGEGGDTRLDVYLESQDEFYGFVETLGGHVGDNPHTPVVEEHAAYGYISLSHDYTAETYGALTAGDLLRTTIAHELHHAIQTGYDDSDLQEWLYEATAVWIEEQVYPEIEGGLDYADDYLDAPDLCPLTVGRDDADVRWYGDWLLVAYLADHYGGPDTIRRIWETMIVEDGLDAIEESLAGQNTTLADVVVDFSVANLTTSTCPDNTPYCYAQGERFQRPFVEQVVNVGEDKVELVIPQDGVQQFGADYLRLKSGGPIDLAFSGSDAGRWHLQLVGLQGDAYVVTAIDPAQISTTNPAKYDRLYLVIVNTASAGWEAECGYHNYTLAVADSANTGHIQPPEPADDPPPYLAPSLEQSEETLDEFPTPDLGQPVLANDFPFEPVEAVYLPKDYRYAEAVRYDLADLDDWRWDYIPDGDPSITLVYAGPTERDYLTITTSLTGYDRTEAWVEARGYYENYIRLVDDVSVFLVDYSDEEDLFSYATLVIDDRFVVIDGTIDFWEMQHVVAGLMAGYSNP
ncbi:MAG: DUF6055 domain-containing protein [Anaerolineae bacterium]|nr:DUF6055 domain-containing protein [Anaerolineae bacterium]